MKDKELKKRFDILEERLKEIDQEVKLGTWDNVILALMVFFVALSLTLLSYGIPSNLKNSPFILGFMLVIMLAIPVLGLIYPYITSIFFKENRFSMKIYVISWIAGLIMFCALIILFSLLIWILSIYHYTIPELVLTIFMLVIILITTIFIILFIRPKIKEFFLQEYPNLFLKRISKLNKNQRVQALKNLNISYNNLKKLIKNYR